MLLVGAAASIVLAGVTASTGGGQSPTADPGIEDAVRLTSGERLGSATAGVDTASRLLEQVDEGPNLSSGIRLEAGEVVDLTGGTVPGSGTATGVSSLAAAITELPSAGIGFPEAEQVIAPATLTIESLGIDQAPVIGVGVTGTGDFEVPPAEKVGWYRFGPPPGADGSAVLAAHIAYDGVDGVFRYLDDMDPGQVIEVTYDDGSVIDFVVERRVQYGKEELPDEVFARRGEPQLVLITCGGDFNPDLRSYEDNIVVYAVPA